jgi:hypothetical protein
MPVSTANPRAPHERAVRRVWYPLFTAGMLGAVLVWSGGLVYAPLRWGLVGLVSVLVVVWWLGRRTGVLGPVGAGRAARLVRAGGSALVAAIGTTFVVSIASHGDPAEQTRFGVPIFTVLLTCYLVGFLAVTSARSMATGRVLATGAGAGVAAAGLWLVAVVVAAPIPADVGMAVFLTTAAMAAAVWANAGERGSNVGALLAALSAGTVAMPLVFVLVVLLSSYGPPRLVPDLVPAALSPADDLANSRIEVQDPYVALLFVAGLLAVALSAASIATRSRPSAPPSSGRSAELGSAGATT